MLKNSCRILAILLLTAAQGVATAATAPLAELAQSSQQAKTAHLIGQILSQYHYKAMPLDESMSDGIFDQFLKALDSERLIFTQEDIDRMSQLRPLMAAALRSGNLAAPFAVINLYLQRAEERFSYARQLVQGNIDFSQPETYQYSREKEPWPQTSSEMDNLWRKRVKNDWLRLKLAGKDEAAIRETLDKRYDTSLKRLARTNNDDAFQIFMNAYTMAIEPHTNYLGYRAAEDFEISMKLSLVGIGAVLSEKNEYTTVNELISGGPAALSGQLKAGDRIVGLAQGKHGAMIDVMGWRLDDVVAQIRGAADSTIVLDILPVDAGPDGAHRQVTLVRKKVNLEEQSAKSTVLPIGEGSAAKRIGVITLPSFYDDFSGRQRGDTDFRSAASDVARLLEKLKKERVDAILVDLRDNGGGSLTEAIDVTGLFVGKGPILQQRNAEGNVTVLSNKRQNVAWRGPLGVLINRGSASASEIFAAAIQDYGRGVIIGERSFGKGTVQTMLNLDDVVKDERAHMGELKFTVAQFFRVTGGTTQLKGVTPDVLLPSSPATAEFGESGFDNALPWTQIKAVDYAASDRLQRILPELRTRSASRAANDPDFRCLQDTIALAESEYQRNTVSLREVERKQEQQERDGKLRTCRTSAAASTASSEAAANDKAYAERRDADDGLQDDERAVSTDKADSNARKAAKDVLLSEAARILSDEAKSPDGDWAPATQRRLTADAQGGGTPPNSPPLNATAP